MQELQITMISTQQRYIKYYEFKVPAKKLYSKKLQQVLTDTKKPKEQFNLLKNFIIIQITAKIFNLCDAKYTVQRFLNENSC